MSSTIVAVRSNVLEQCARRMCGERIAISIQCGHGRIVPCILGIAISIVLHEVTLFYSNKRDLSVPNGDGQTVMATLLWRV